MRLIRMYTDTIPRIYCDISFIQVDAVWIVSPLFMSKGGNVISYWPANWQQDDKHVRHVPIGYNF